MEPAAQGTDRPVIAVAEVTKDYGTTRALDRVTFDVPRGAVVALLGPNGSGKSSLMRIITGYFPPTSGSIFVDGVDVGLRSTWARRNVGYLPENVTLYPDLTVRRYLAFVAGMKGFGGSRARSAIDRVIERCRLGDVASRATGVLSKGYRQRVGLAQALLGDPSILVLDEPTVGLDPVQTVELRTLIAELRDRTVMLSTHVLSEASAVCSHVVILSRGRLVAVETPDGLAGRARRARRVQVRVDGDGAAMHRALAALPGVDRVEAIPERRGDGATFQLHGADPGAEVAAMVVGHGWRLRELTEVVPTLEDLFVEMVGPDRPGVA